MRQYKKENGKYWIKLGILYNWEPLEDHIKRIRKEAKEKSKTLKDKLKAKAIKKIKEI